MATLKKTKALFKKKAEYGIKSTPADSTGYFQGRIKKADQLLGAAEKEGLGKDYVKPFQDTYGKTLKDAAAYQRRKATPTDTTKSVATLKKGGKIPCAKCGSKTKKK